MKTEPLNAELEERIAGNPGDVGAWKVYADWLHEQGSPRGELAAVQLAREEKRYKKYRERAEALLDAHGDQFLGKKNGRFRIDDNATVLTWKGGFWKRIGLSADAKTIAGALSHPSARLLQSLSLNPSGPKLGDTVSAMPSLPALRRLTIGAIPEGQSEGVESSRRTIDGLASLPARVPRLERLTLRATDFEVGTFPALTRLAVHSDGLTPATLRSLLTTPQPRLERLRIAVIAPSDDDGEYQPTLSAADFDLPLPRETFPTLQRLWISLLCHQGVDLAAVKAKLRATPLGKSLERVTVDENFTVEE